MTDIDPHLKSAWDRKTRIELGRALLCAHPRPLGAAELAAATRRDPSNTRKVADELVAAKVLDTVEPSCDRRKGKSGRKPDRLFAFAADEREKFAERFGAPEEPAMRSGSQLVFVDISSLGKELVACLARPALSGARWAAICDGKRQELVIAFEGNNASEASLDLMAVLAAAEAEASRAVVSDLYSGVDLVHRFGQMRDG